MRTRSRSTSLGTAPRGGWLIEHSRSEGGVSSVLSGDYISALSPMSLGTDVEVIIDDVSKSRVTKNVTHTRHRFERLYQSGTDYRESTDSGVAYGYPSGYIVDTYRVVGGYSGYPGDNYHWYSWGLYGELPQSALVSSYSKSTSDLLRAAMKKALFFNEVDNLLNIIESPQLVSSFKDISSSLSSTKEMFKGIRRRNLVSLTSKNPSMTVVLREGAGDIFRNRGKRFDIIPNAYLAYMFGVAPLLADIKKVSNAVKDLKRSVDEYVKNFEKPFTATAQVRGSLSIDPSYSGSGFYHSDATRPSGKWWTTGPSSSYALKTVGVRARRNIHYNSDAFKKLQYFLDRFVSNGPASFVWEKIKFSFVVDWFVDLSNIVGSLDNLLSGDRISFTDGWQSEKWSCHCPVRFSPYAPWSTPNLGPGSITADNEYSYYHREYLEPHIVVGLSNRFGKKQATESAALLYQLVAKLRR